MEDIKYSVEIQNITKHFGSTVAVNNLDLKIIKGEFISLLGPSGCGKTTLLRMISGLLEPEKGKIIISGKDMTFIDANKRPVNMVFQSYGLFPHMNVYENIAFGPRIKKWSESYIKEKVEEMLDLVSLSGFENRFPSQLSGGQKQRIALARALINNPEVLLLDEPLGALDLQIRKQMQLELRRIHNELKNTFIYVTHDQEEALVMSDRIVLMKDGKICQIGTPDEIYNNPKNSFTASFVGESNLIAASFIKYLDKIALLKFNNSNILVSCQEIFKNEKELRILIRPENIEIFDKNNYMSLDNKINATVLSTIFLGSDIKYEVKVSEDFMITVRKSFKKNQRVYSPGEKVIIGWDKEDSIIIRD